MKILPAAAIALAATAVACSKPQQPKVEMKALETARALEADLGKKAQGSLEAADKLSK